MHPENTDTLREALQSISDMLHGSWDNACTAMEVADKALAGWKGLRIPPSVGAAEAPKPDLAPVDTTSLQSFKKSRPQLHHFWMIFDDILELDDKWLRFADLYARSEIERLAPSVTDEQLEKKAADFAMNFYHLDPLSPIRRDAGKFAAAFYKHMLTHKEEIDEPEI